MAHCRGRKTTQCSCLRRNILLLSQSEDSDNPTSEVMMILNADQCAAVYAPYANGTLEAPSNRWQECKDESTLSYNGTLPHGEAWSWQSPEALLKMHIPKRAKPGFSTFIGSISQVHWPAQQQLVIENADVP